MNHTPTPAKRAPVESLRVLVVEDEGAISLDIKAKLNMMGYTPVGVAVTGEEAIAKATELLPDLVLMDVHLRGSMDGIMTAAELQRRFDIPVVYLTAFADTETVARAKETNPFGYLIKPFYEKDLRTTVEIALYRHRMERDLKDARARLEGHGRRQATLAELGVRALAGGDLPTLFAEACRRVTGVLGVEYCGVMELQANGSDLVLRGGAGWAANHVGQVMVQATDSQAGYSLLSKSTVLVEDLPRETRFTPSPSVLAEGIRSGLTAPIEGGKAPYGVLAVNTKDRRTFDQDEVNFVQAMANLLAMAIERKRDQEQLIRQATILTNVRDCVIVTDRQGNIVHWNSGAAAIFGYGEEAALGKSMAMLYPPDIRKNFEGDLAEVMTGREQMGERARVRKDGAPIVADMRASALHGPGGEPAGIVSIERDITERKQMEETIRQLSTPTMQVREGMLLLPLIGMIDARRARQLMEQLLQAVRSKRARVVVIDLTGVGAVDDTAAQNLVETAEATRLLGATVILTGISSAIAHTLVEIGENLKGLHIAGDLQSGIEEAGGLLAGLPARGKQTQPENGAVTPR